MINVCFISIKNIEIYLQQKMMIYDVLVIGAGISGIGASLQLSKHQVEHIILEGRSNIGGRIASKVLDGVEIQLGANFVTEPNNNNKIAELIKEMGETVENITFDAQQYFCQGEENLSEDTIEKALGLFEELCQEMVSYAQTCQNDISMGDGFGHCLQKIQDEEQWVQNIIKLQIDVLANIEGGRLSQISAKQYDINAVTELTVPEKGYFGIFELIAKGLKAQIKFNQIVTKIDYSDEIVKIHTKDAVYLARKVLSSLPMGVMKNKTVEFHPSLPEKIMKIYDQVGFGVQNKLFVSFEEAFWNPENEWLYFVTKEGENWFPFCKSVKKDRAILVFFLSAETSHYFNSFSDQQVLEHLLKFLAKFNFKTQPKVRGFELTRWHSDPFSLGSYYFKKVGSKSSDLQEMSAGIDNKVWLIGDYWRYGLAHGAFEKGIMAADQVFLTLKKPQ